MNHRLSRMQHGMTATVICLVGCALISACAGDQPKALPPPTPDQARSHSDKTFDKLKQEEQERGTQPNMPR